MGRSDEARGATGPPRPYPNFDIHLSTAASIMPAHRSAPAPHVRDAAAGTPWPAAFVIVTACATTGETWSDTEEAAADARLRAELVARGAWHVRLTGYHPATGHAEPGWAAALPVAEGCALGRRYRQDAIFVVAGDALAVTACDGGWGPVAMGGFRGRVD